MEIKILWSDTALIQLEDIFDYHKTKTSYTIARKHVKSIVQKALILRETPLLGVKETLLSNRHLNIDSLSRRIIKSFTALMIT